MPFIKPALDIAIDLLGRKRRVLMALEHRLKAEPAATEDDLLSRLATAKEDCRGKPQHTLA